MNILITSNKIDDNLINILNIFDYKEVNIELLLMDNCSIADVPSDVKISYFKDYLLEPNKLLYNLKKKIFVTDLYDKFRFALKQQYDVSIAYSGDDNYIDMVAASVKASKKIIWLHETIKYNHINKLMSRKFKYFDKIICVSNDIKTNFDRQFNCNIDTVVINPLTDGEKIKKLAKEQMNLRLGKSYNIVSNSNMEENNSCNILIDLIYKLKDNGYNVNAYIIGEGKGIYDIVNKITKLKLNNNIMLLGKMSNPYNILSKADLYINISNDDICLLDSNILDKPFISLNNEKTSDIMSIVPINGGIVCNEVDLYKVVAKQIHAWQKHISFDYKKYEKNIITQIIDAIET